MNYTPKNALTERASDWRDVQLPIEVGIEPNEIHKESCV